MTQTQDGPHQSATLRRVVAEALASVRADGLEPSPEGLEMFEKVASGRMTPREGIERVLARYRAAPETPNR